MIAQSQSGTGKTAAFVLSMLSRVDATKNFPQVKFHKYLIIYNNVIITHAINKQRAKNVVSDSPGLVDFAIGLVNSVLNLPDGQAKIFRRVKITKVL